MRNVIINFHSKNSSSEINYLIQKGNTINLEPFVICISNKIEKLSLFNNTKVVFLITENINKIDIKNVINSVNNYIKNDDLVVSSSSDFNNEFINLLAFNNKKIPITNGTNIEKRGSDIVFTKLIYSSNLSKETIASNNNYITLSYDSKEKIDESKITEITEYDVNDIKEDIKPSFTLISTEKKEINKLKNANKVLLIGKGVNKEYIEKAKLLAKKLNFEVGATRPVTYNLDMPLSTMIGSSNISVSPKILIALGVSGSAPLIEGIKNSQKIIAINKDKSAMIFNHSNIGALMDTKDFIDLALKNIEEKND